MGFHLIVDIIYENYPKQQFRQNFSRGYFRDNKKAALKNDKREKVFQQKKYEWSYSENMNSTFKNFL